MRFPGILLIVSVLTASCNFAGMHRVKGNGVHSSVNRSAGSFTNIELTGPMDLMVTQGSTPGVRVETDENLQQYVETKVEGNTLRVRLRDGYSIGGNAQMKIYVTAPALSALHLTGSGDVTSGGRFSGNRLDIRVTGSGSVTLDVDMPVVDAEVTGSGTVRLKGVTRDFRSQTNGSGEIEAFDLMAENTRVEIAGSGDAQVFASKRLDIEIAGSGDVTYRGTASVNQEVHGSGSVRKVD